METACIVFYPFWVIPTMGLKGVFKSRVKSLGAFLIQAGILMRSDNAQLSVYNVRICMYVYMYMYMSMSMSMYTYMYRPMPVPLPLTLSMSMYM